MKPQNFWVFACRQVSAPHYLHSICLSSLTSISKSFTQEHVRRGAVSVVPHEGVCESLVAWRQVVHPPQFHAVLFAVTVVIWLAVDMVMLRPAGEPVCRESGACVTWLPKRALFCTFLVRSAGTYSMTEKSAGTNSFTQRSYRYSYRYRINVSVIIPWHKKVTATHNVTEEKCRYWILDSRKFRYSLFDRRKCRY